MTGNGAAGALRKRKRTEVVFKALMIGSTAVVISSLLIIIGTIVWKGLPALNLAMITRTPKGGFYLGREGGILNAIVGSLELVLGATALAFLLSLPLALYLNLYKGRNSRTAMATRCDRERVVGSVDVAVVRSCCRA